MPSAATSTASAASPHLLLVPWCASARVNCSATGSARCQPPELRHPCSTTDTAGCLLTVLQHACLRLHRAHTAAPQSVPASTCCLLNFLQHACLRLHRAYPTAPQRVPASTCTGCCAALQPTLPSCAGPAVCLQPLWAASAGGAGSDRPAAVRRLHPAEDVSSGHEPIHSQPRRSRSGACWAGS